MELRSAGVRGRGDSNATCIKRMKRMRGMRRRNGMGVGRHRDEHEPTNRFLRSKEAPVDERLFPRIPDEITWDQIVPKLSWTALPVLSSVSRAWKKAIRSNRVYEERVRANSLETLFIHHHGETMALYSTSENCCYELPPIFRLPRGHLGDCRCIALGGKIYILGGLEVPGRPRVSGPYVPWNVSGKVHVLDLGRGLWQWIQCASMLEPRGAFGCGVIDDKIYVFGGRAADGKIGGAEVYDAQKNAWSPITAVGREIYINQYTTAAPVGKELFLYDNNPSSIAVYNPAKDEWRLLECFWEQSFPAVVFVTQGKFYSFSNSGIDVLDVQQKSRINRHTHSFAALPPDECPKHQPISVLAVKDELFSTTYPTIGSKVFAQSYHCKGFESEEKEMVWQRACSFRTVYARLVQFPIQL